MRWCVTSSVIRVLGIDVGTGRVSSGLAAREPVPCLSATTNLEEGDAVSVTLRKGSSAREHQDLPVTLAEAHEWVWQQRPKGDVEPRERAAYHRKCASVYSRVASIDVRHQHEASQCAGLEIRKARDIEHELNPDGDDPDGDS